jgi:CMP-N-acetylneuraminic acid synthetase
VKNLKILGIIPARGGSKGIPQKNLRKILGKPMIQYSIDAAKKSKINKIIVSTDNKKIAKFAESQNIEVPFMRPKKFASDSAKTIDVIKHTLNFLDKNQNYQPDIVIILQPTSPMRTSTIINRSINLLHKNKTTSVISVSKIKTHPNSSFSYNGTFLKPFRKDFKKFDRRQKNESLYFPTGSIYTTFLKTIKKYDSIYGPNIKPIITEQDESIDIDSIYDLFVSEMTMKYWEIFRKKFS